MNRRALLFGCTVLVPLAACKGLTPDQGATDASLIATGLSGIVDDLAAIPGLKLPPSVVDAIKSELAIIVAEAPQIGTVVSAGAASPAQQINTAVTVIAQLTTPYFAQAPFVAAAVQAAVVLAGTLVGMFAVSTASGARMSPEAARLLLEGNAKRYQR